jgi:hypothetical protein
VTASIPEVGGGQGLSVPHSLPRFLSISLFELKPRYCSKDSFVQFFPEMNLDFPQKWWWEVGSLLKEYSSSGFLFETSSTLLSLLLAL